jgi:inorganic pyrophosphatase
MHDVHDLGGELRDEIEHFFRRYKELEHKPTETRGFGNRSEAEQIIREARVRVSA